MHPQECYRWTAEQQCKRFRRYQILRPCPAAGRRHAADASRARARQRGKHDRHRDFWGRKLRSATWRRPQVQQARQRGSRDKRRGQCRCALHRGTAVWRKLCSSTGIAAQHTQ